MAYGQNWFLARWQSPLRQPLNQVSRPCQTTSISPTGLNPSLTCCAAGQAAEQKADPKWSKLLAYRGDSSSPDLTALEREQMLYRAGWFEVHEGLLYHKAFAKRNKFDARTQRRRLVVPDHLRRFVISHLHDSVTSAHLGSSKVVAGYHRRFYFPGAERYIKDHVRTCHRCQLARGTRDLQAGLYQGKTNIARPGHLGIDIQGPFPQSGHDVYIVTMKDSFTHFVVLATRPGTENAIDGGAIAELVFKKWVAYKGIPLVLTSDRGPQFMSALLLRFCELLGIDKANTATYHPQSNTEPERQHAFHLPLFKALTADEPRRWSKFVPYIQFACNSSEVDGHGMSPFELESGYEPLLPVDLYRWTPRELQYQVSSDMAKYKMEHALLIKKAHDLVNRVNKERRAADKARYDRKRHEVSYQNNDLVLAYRPHHVQGSHKLALSMRGPFTVVKRASPVTYVIRHEESGVEWPAHVSNLAPYHKREPDQPTDWPAVDSELPAPERTPHVRPDVEPAPARLPTAGASALASPSSQSALPEDLQDFEADIIEVTNVSNNNVFIAPSGGRLGVFARRPMRSQTSFGEYKGELLTKSVHDRRHKDQPSQYSVALPHKMFVDATRQGNFTRFINSAGPTQRPNVEFVVSPNGKQVFVWTVSDVPAGTELLADYGPLYDWLDRQDLPLEPREVLPLPQLTLDLQKQLREALLQDPTEEKKAAPSAEQERPPSRSLLSLTPGQFVLAATEDDESILNVCRVLEVEEFGETVTVHIYGPTRSLGLPPGSSRPQGRPYRPHTQANQKPQILLHGFVPLGSSLRALRHAYFLAQGHQDQASHLDST